LKTRLSRDNAAVRTIRSRDLALAVVAVALAVFLVGCRWGPTPPPPLPSCNGVERVPTGHLEEDIVGAWSQLGDGTAESYHPITRFGPGNLLVVFDADGTGRAQWLFVGPASDEAGETSFDWRVENDMLMVDDHPPAAVRFDTGSARVSNADGEGGTAFWARCELQEEG
jgi:hypothetical protein